MRYRSKSDGFALPTVIITSVVLFAVLVVAVGMAASTSTALNAQYYENLAADAAESGAAQTGSCLRANGYVSAWGSKNLTPGTDCTGNVVAGQNASVVSTPAYSSTYSVSPVTNSSAGVQTARVTGTVSLMRSSGTVWQTYKKTLIIQVGGQIGANQVVLGYEGSNGAFFGSVGGDGSMRTVGYNGQGQLGNGTFSNTLTPQLFQTPMTSYIVAGYSNFLSVGFRLYAVDSNGNAFGAGSNSYGSLGVGIAGAQDIYSTGFSTPKLVLIPGKKIRYVVVGQTNDYFVTTDNNVYSAGGCQDGRLGYNYTISGCADQPTPVRVNLPALDPSNPNTIPTDNFVTDRGNAYIRMAGGAVYGWGLNDNAQLGGQAFISSANPIKIGTYGDTGKPAAAQVAFDGNTLYILDGDGKVNSLGFASPGNMGNPSMSLKMNPTGNCMANIGGNGKTVGLAPCTGTSEQAFQLRSSDNMVYNAATNTCLNNPYADGVSLEFHSCVGATTQTFIWSPTDRSLYNPRSNKCVTFKDSTTLQLATCTGASTQILMGYNGNLTPFNTSGMSGKITKIWTDQRALVCLTSTGQIWGAGLNSAGQFGNGTVAEYQPDPVQFNMPVAATDVYETYSGGGGAIPYYQNLYAIGADGKVYGAGSNKFGQLGNGTMSDYSATPVVMSLIDGSTIVASQVQSGFGTTVIFTTNGSVYTVGNNNSGQLGDGTTTSSPLPIKAKYLNSMRLVTF